MRIIRSNLLSYLHSALVVYKNNDQYNFGGEYGEKQSIKTAAIIQTIKAIENGEQLEITD